MTRIKQRTAEYSDSLLQEYDIYLVGAAFSRDKRRQHGVTAIFAAESRSHEKLMLDTDT
jgi:hypothetical protein